MGGQVFSFRFSVCSGRAWDFRFKRRHFIPPGAHTSDVFVSVGASLCQTVPEPR